MLCANHSLGNPDIAEFRMPRQLRHHVPGGWYHITTRGLGKRTIFETDRDHEHFMELLGGMVERYDIILHAHVELDNHYHLLIESPEGNVSQAMQWLNTSYSVWFNIKHARSGALFKYRFKSRMGEGSPMKSEVKAQSTCSSERPSKLTSQDTLVLP